MGDFVNYAALKERMLRRPAVARVLENEKIKL